MFSKLKRSSILLLISFLIGGQAPALAESGADLWLRHEGNGSRQVIANAKFPEIDLIQAQLSKFWSGNTVTLNLTKSKGLTSEGYRLEKCGDSFSVTSPSPTGLLYGVFDLIRRQSGKSLDTLGFVTENPAFPIRILNHWDNPDGSVERGYAGNSLWKWDELPDVESPRYREYARANASIGINGTVLNNVNAKAEVLSAESLCKVKTLADIFRPYGIKVYLSINFDSPKKLGGLPTSDPLDKGVRKWWKNKADEIYSMIPDFGGFLVKANSEGTAGPLDYGRTHADGANMLADILKPHKGIVMWRAFVYNPEEPDRAKQAYNEFMPLDGKFKENVILQIKNGPIDFQPREPYTPLFGNLSHTNNMVEFQITQEYLGHSNHLAFLAPMWEEFFNYVSPSSLSAMAGVANIGDDTNWCGNDMAQANWYAFGRLAWNPTISSRQIAEEWLSQTFTPDEGFVAPVSDMMLASRETVVSYMMPLGLHHIFAKDHHYGPQPWFFEPDIRVDWTATHYHKADKEGIGFNRSSSGTNAVAQYPGQLASRLDDMESCPEEFILWFHHVPWSHKFNDGETLWSKLCHKYDSGVKEVRDFQKTWDRMEPYVDAERFESVRQKLRMQAREAVWWKDACLQYFQEFSGMPIPYDIERPIHSLSDMKAFKLDLGICGNAPHGFPY